MPKQKIKTHKGTAKRVRRTAGGKGSKLIHEHAFNNHFREKKSAARKRSLAGKATITGAAANNIKRALGV